MTKTEQNFLESSANGYSNRVKEHIEAGVNVNIRADYGDTALIFAVKYGYAETVKLLIEYGSDVSIRNSDGETALDIAKEKMKIFRLNNDYQYKEAIELLNDATAIRNRFILSQNIDKISTENHIFSI